MCLQKSLIDRFHVLLFYVWISFKYYHFCLSECWTNLECLGCMVSLSYPCPWLPFFIFVLLKFRLGTLVSFVQIFCFFFFLIILHLSLLVKVKVSVYSWIVLFLVFLVYLLFSFKFFVLFFIWTNIWSIILGCV